ncbi:substrate-binding periplasmic protein [Paucibacter sp. DJ2R-2]|uniref:substrate-binding periplasmic protein n=1 Tax=Paucibacter sp. DJ2R-2 TaxID=2893558 RepID=UPI0021E38C77|nr:transporter substrate-binding domain-containing protein [Paucibacter sp. DJ2R-2]MCV2420034.1 transporter substrate-binding domain-containing protein [Paucibacter sp. DJ4R-1]MCV2437039.1 transporter substrate-binding domain-containing protein [Paucibacter sp. DJ2R-2]
MLPNQTRSTTLTPCPPYRQRLLLAAALVAAAWGTAALAQGSAAPANSQVGSQPAVRVCVGDFPPYNSPRLPRMGPIFDLAQQAFQRVGYTMQAEFMPWARILKEGEEGRCLILGIWRNATRDQLFDYSSPLVEQELGFFVKRGSQQMTHNAESLRRLRIGVERGSYLPELLRDPGLQLDLASALNSNLRKLAKDRIDLAFGAKDAGLYMLAKEPELRARIDWLAPGLESKPTYLAFSRRDPQAEALRSAFEQGLAAMKADGSYRRLLKAAGLSPLP